MDAPAPAPPTYPDAVAHAGSHPRTGIYGPEAARSRYQYLITNLRADKGRRRESGSIF